MDTTLRNSVSVNLPRCKSAEFRLTATVSTVANLNGDLLRNLLCHRGPQVYVYRR